MNGIFLMAFYCEAYEFCEGQCEHQCATCRQEDADEEAMQEDFAAFDDIQEHIQK